MCFMCTLYSEPQLHVMHATSDPSAGKAGMQALLEAVPPVSEHFHVSSKIGEGV